MSWSVSVPATPAEQFADAVKAARIDDSYNKSELVEQWGEQLEAAKAAALAIFAAHPFGEGGTYSAGMSGHANHGGAGEGTGYTPSEFVYVNVHRVPASKPAEEPSDA